MANATVMNPMTFRAAVVCSSTFTTPALNISDANNNVFLGLTLPASLGSNNIGIGNTPLPSFSSGTGNIALGQQSLLGLNTGTDNIGIGRQSGVNAGTATRCTFLGPQTGFEEFAGPFTDSTAVGSGAALNANNQIMMGRSSETVVFPGNSTFNANLPTSTASVTTSTQLIPRAYADTNLLSKTIATSISYTGTLYTISPFIVTTGGYSLVNSSASMVPIYSSQLYTESKLLTLTFNDTGILLNFNGTFAAMTSCSGPNVVGFTGTMGSSFASLTTFSFPNLVYSANFLPSFSVLTTLSLPALRSFVNVATPTAPLLTTLDLPVLEQCLLNFGPTFASLTTFSLPSFTYTSQFSAVLAACTSVSLPVFANVGTSFAFTAATLTTLSLPALVSVGSTFVITAANLVTFSIGSTLKNIGGNFTMSGMKLNQASVDSILVSLAALDGTNGTTAYSGRTISINGGTSAAPSATGLTAKTTLQARGCTVITN